MRKYPLNTTRPRQFILSFVSLIFLGLLPIPAGGEQRSFSKTMAKDLRWRGLCAATPSNRQTNDVGSQIFCVHSPSTTRIVASQKAGSFIQDWLKHHPGATYRAIINTPMMISDPTSPKETWIWISDGESILNVELVRAGMCAATSMKAGEEDRLLISSEEYEQFSRRIDEAENSAKLGKLGIWS